MGLVTDFRSDPMPSSEGRGIARRAWEGYEAATGEFVEAALGPSIRSYSASTVGDLLGFWLLWHMEGGFEGLRELGLSRGAIYRKTALFRRVVGVHPDEFEMPGVTIDLEVLQSSGSARPAATDDA